MTVRPRVDKRRHVEPFTDDDIFLLLIAPASRQAILASATWPFDTSLGTENTFAERWRNHGAPVMERWEKHSAEAVAEECWPADEPYPMPWPAQRFGLPTRYTLPAEAENAGEVRT